MYTIWNPDVPGETFPCMLIFCICYVDFPAGWSFWFQTQFEEIIFRHRHIYWFMNQSAPCIEPGWCIESRLIFFCLNSSNNSDSGYILKFKILVPYQRSMINLANETFFSTIGYIGNSSLYMLLFPCGILPFVRLQAITCWIAPLRNKRSLI